MSDTLSAARVEPILDPGAIPAPPPPPVVPPAAPSADDRAATAGVATPVPPPRASGPASSVHDQLARLEDKTSRIEEKLSRAEASTQRVVDRFEAASHRMSEVAQQSDLTAVRGDAKFIARRVRNLPGFAALVLASVITALLSSALTVVILRYLPQLLAR